MSLCAINFYIKLIKLNILDKACTYNTKRLTKFLFVISVFGYSENQEDHHRLRKERYRKASPYKELKNRTTVLEWMQSQLANKASEVKPDWGDTEKHTETLPSHNAEISAMKKSRHRKFSFL